jgi:hypothetical protein
VLTTCDGGASLVAEVVEEEEEEDGKEEPAGGAVASRARGTFGAEVVLIIKKGGSKRTDAGSAFVTEKIENYRSIEKRDLEWCDEVERGRRSTMLYR